MCTMPSKRNALSNVFHSAAIEAEREYPQARDDYAKAKEGESRKEKKEASKQLDKSRGDSSTYGKAAKEFDRRK
ncbi:hypothetical protein BOTBODRAFT_188280 [Botryobasidium botryosum FD-172 SS1]|uniref:Uncharacterized protein n=1 Tax=Botryobasidium botryosum (strain FD-172 SS1) TaxID=930990 RepID=A0A067MPN8_BOTB1|nr:hypothetical protein BOTBODRAFT_188280 [Botryobasidium botryosum FD-172 SS1]